MKPFESPEGRKGVGFEGHAEIGTLAAGLELMIELTGLDKENRAIREASAMAQIARDILHVDGELAKDPLVRAAMGGDDTTEATVVLDIDDPHQLQLADWALSAAEQRHEDDLVRRSAEITHIQFLEQLALQGLIETPEAP